MKNTRLLLILPRSSEKPKQETDNLKGQNPDDPRHLQARRGSALSYIYDRPYIGGKNQLAGNSDL